MVDTNTHSLADLANRYQAALQRVATRRKDWHERLKPLLQRTLSQLVDSHDIGWFVDKNDDTQNLESIFLAFGHVSSGIRYQTELKSGIYVRRGGYLGFSLTANGMVVIWMAYPFVADLEIPPDNKDFANLEPADISEAVIHEYVERFLQSLIECESRTKPRIGFGRE